jgi:hypothetical protein
MRRLNPSRNDDGPTLVALKPLDLLKFLTATKRKNPRNDSDRRNSVATRLRFAA